jgi:DNA polymerase III delta prime subunit
METYSANCRFILTCNHVDKVIAPIQSRCIRFNFDQFPKRRVVSLCEKILEKEGIPLPEKEELTALVDRYFPDIRSVVQGLQAACLSGEYNPKALSQVMVDPYEICELVLDGRLMSIRQLVAGVTDFMFIYRFMMDTFIRNIEDPVTQGLMIDAVVDAVRVENVVPDREINFIGCLSGMFEALEVMLAAFQDHAQFDDDDANTIDKARAALAQAQGEENHAGN